MNEVQRSRSEKGMEQKKGELKLKEQAFWQHEQADSGTQATQSFPGLGQSHSPWASGSSVTN